MSYDVSIKINNLAAFRREMDRLHRNMVMAGTATALAMSKRVTADVIDKYLNRPKLPLKESTLDKRWFGKRAGTRPAIPVYTSAKPLVQSGKLASLVEMVTQKHTKSRDFITRLRPGVNLPSGTGYSRGGISDMVGMVHEFGETHVITVTEQMRKYLFVLLEQAGNKESVITKGAKGTNTITIVIPKRPVWTHAAHQLILRQPKEFGTIFGMKMNKLSRFKIVIKA